jgi:hypothetical protein
MQINLGGSYNVFSTFAPSPQMVRTPYTLWWSYSSDDPFAYTLTFCSETHETEEWVVGRDLLAIGAHDETGIGDVHIVPWSQFVLMELTDSANQSSVYVWHPRDAYERMLNLTLRLLPQGTESKYIDWDSGLKEILNG